MSDTTATAFLAEARRSLRAYKRLAEGALAQVSDEQLFQQLDPEANSIAILVKHISGNLRSRWTDFLTTDGDKPDRHREREFEQTADRRVELMSAWEDAWQRLFSTLDSLHPDDLDRTVTIAGEPYSVLKAINVAAMHYAQHIGQLVFVAKHLRGAEWQSLSIPKPGREAFQRGK